MHYVYDPFGIEIVVSGNLGEKNTFRFSTKYWDGECRLYYYGFRHYAPELGRWLSRDPVEEFGSLILRNNDNINNVGTEEVIDLKNIIQIIIELEEKFNPYLYCSNNIFSSFDLLGLCEIIQKLFTGIAHGSRNTGDIHAIMGCQGDAHLSHSMLQRVPIKVSSCPLWTKNLNI